MSSLKSQLIKLGTENPELRKHLKPILDSLEGSTKTASGTKRMEGMTFEVEDMRGKGGFPSDDSGLVYYLDISLPTTNSLGREEMKERTYVIRTDAANRGWRVDKVDAGLPEKVRDLDGYYATPEEAAKALSTYLGKIRSGLITRF
jgi:hypothetical protein